MERDGKPKDFFYLDRRIEDGRLGIISLTFASGQCARFHR
jgi:hypothetical protein